MTPSTLAIVHFHLRSGGVTRVIAHAAKALRETPTRIVVLSGEAPAPGWSIPAELRVVEGLAYDEGAEPASAARLSADLLSAAVDALGVEPDLWHVHNHALGKNLALPVVLRQWTEQGRRMLLQLHDFAEDGRPANYRRLLAHLGSGDTCSLGRTLYPLAGHIHYAALNSRDISCLREAGAPEEQAHLLPNAVDLDMEAEAVRDRPPEASGPPCVLLYPARGIGRKNLGELLLWSAMGMPRTRLAVTAAPINPVHRPGYERWVGLARELNLPVAFEAAASSPLPFPALMAGADALVTTSMAEGFGMAFLEPWLVGRMLLGRDLPWITADFKECGVDLSSLYARLEIPLAWIGRERLLLRLESVLREYDQAYARPWDPDRPHRVLQSIVREDRADFGRLDPAMQERVIRRVHSSPNARGELRPSDLWSMGGGHGAGGGDRVIAHNRRVVRESFDLQNYARRLQAIYARVLESSTGSMEHLDARELLNRFLAPENLSLIRM